MSRPRIYLSSPHMGGDEVRLVLEAFASNWIAPLGPHVDKFEAEFASYVGRRRTDAGGRTTNGGNQTDGGARFSDIGQQWADGGSPPAGFGRQPSGGMYAAALSSGTAALHLAMRWLNLRPGDEIVCSTLTFSASVNPVLYERAVPVFVDCDEVSWNMDPALLTETVEDRIRKGRKLKAVIVVHLYGQSADLDPIAATCARHGIPLIEDAAEALGATYKGSAPGSFGLCSVHSFNGNKIITTSGGGMLVSNDGNLIEKARYWATQARDPAPHYQHSEIGFNYRMSNVLAAIGRGQLRVLEQRVEARRRNFAYYKSALGDLPGLHFMPEADYGRSTRWLTCLTIDPNIAGTDREKVRLALAEENIEARPVWKPMHLQPIFKGCRCYGGSLSERLFDQGLCLPSGSNLRTSDLDRVIDVIRRVWAKR